MRLNILIMTFFILLANGCVNKSQYQIEYEKIKGKAMFEDFDIKMYGESQRKKIDEFLYIEEGKKRRQTSSVRGYIDYIEYDKPSLLEEYIVYYLNGKIKDYVLKFRNSGFFITEIEFNENKKITKNIDYDEKYKYKPYQLFELIEKDYKEIDLWSDHTFISRYKHDKKFYKDYQKLKVIFNEFVENIPLKEDDEPELYWIETVIEKDYEVNPYGKDLKIDLIINAQTGELMIYGKYELEDATDDVGNESIL
ncbi:MAG: hypothetical protein HRT40_02985 [Campylobacteraceae bacterium]|nr:hypothetical protein [Campylobacteraceae bacterium]